MSIPYHIAIIMDGNGRWGINKNNNRLTGHKAGIKNLKKIIEYCIEKKISNLTIYALSRDNLKKRKYREINNILNLLKNYLIKNINYFIKEKIKINFIGEVKELPIDIRKILKSSSNKLKKLDQKLTLNVSLNYSSRIEIINTINFLLKKKKKINQKNIEKNLYTAKSGFPEIVIRTGGYTRLSDFLLWQSSYSEIFFVKKLWPDFSPNDLEKILNKFKSIKRNFGK